MSERERMSRETAPDRSGEDRESDWLRALYAAADLPLKPPVELQCRVAELAARCEAQASRRDGWWPLLPFRLGLVAGAAAAALLLAALGLMVLFRSEHRRSILAQQPH